MGLLILLPPSCIHTLHAPCRYEGNPCNMHLMDLALEVKKGVEEIGLVGYRFNTIGVSDGISMVGHVMEKCETQADSSIGSAESP